MIEAIVTAARQSPDLLHKKFRPKPDAHPLSGHCYVVCEAIYHAVPGYTSMFVRHEGGPHWFLATPMGDVLDPTAEQFATPPDYSLARRQAFLTRAPSRRAAELLRRARLR